jgi:trans-aconitate 2-methyltransferase
VSVAWDAAAYERVAEAQYQWALEVLGWRNWRGDEAVLDAGCGPGRVAEELLRRLPRGRVVAVDRDPDMLEKARRRLAPHADRARVLEADLEALPDLGPVDVVLSTAVLHWVPDHAAAFAGFHRVLKPGGEALLQFGGAGNIADLKGAATRVANLPPFAPHFQGWSPPWHFDEPAMTRRLLEAAGFEGVRAGLEAKTTGFADREAFLAFCIAAPLRPFLGRLPAALAGRYATAVGDLWESEGHPWRLDYVRLNARGRKQA